MGGFRRTRTSDGGRASQAQPKAAWLWFVLGLVASLAAVGFVAAAGGPSVLASAGPAKSREAHDAARRLTAPRLQAPAANARAGSIPAFSWSPVRNAAKYEFQLSADEDFGSIVLGQGKGSFQTLNTYATVDAPLASGAYFWRVRAVTAGDGAGAWSAVRRLTIAWTDRPQLLAPIGGADVA